MIMETLKDPNDHYGTTHHKYTINLPKSFLKQAKIKCEAAGFRELAPYFRAILSREVAEGSLTLRDIIGEREIRRLGWEKIISTPQRREEKKNGFINISSKSFLDKVRKLSVYFKSNTDQQFFEF